MKAPDPTPPADGEKPTCGNCCNSLPTPRGEIGRRLCTALPPQVKTDGRGMARNVYPEMDATKLGCTGLWNVNAQLFHILGQAVTLATQPASNDNGKASPEAPSDNTRA